MQKQFSVGSLDELKPVVDFIVECTHQYNFFTLKGELGSGKTTLIQKVCKELGVTDTVSSPTFSIINEYEMTEGRVYHFDLYRIEEVEELIEIGAEDYFLSNHLCFVEWPEIGMDLFPDRQVNIKIEKQGDIRTFTCLFPD